MGGFVFSSPAEWHGLTNLTITFLFSQSTNPVGWLCYDFDYDDNGISVLGLQIRPKLAAEVQSEYPTLTPGGKVFLTSLLYNNTNLNLSYRFDKL